MLHGLRELGFEFVEISPLRPGEFWRRQIIFLGVGAGELLEDKIAFLLRFGSVRTAEGQELIENFQRGRQMAHFLRFG